MNKTLVEQTREAMKAVSEDPNATETEVYNNLSDLEDYLGELQEKLSWKMEE